MATLSMMVALFFNPMGFDIVQYWLIQATGSLWRANFALYCIAALFFGYFMKNILHNNQIYGVMCGGVLLIIAAILTTRITSDN